MKTNNLFNNIFHRSEIKENKKQYNLYKQQIKEGKIVLELLTKATDLQTVLNIHKDLVFFNHPCIDPDPWGRFRCQLRSTMSPDQVYLGGIYGLNTQAIPFWEAHKNDLYGINSFGISKDHSLYDIVLTQYKNILINTITTLYHTALKEVPKYKSKNY